MGNTIEITRELEERDPEKRVEEESDLPWIPALSKSES